MDSPRESLLDASDIDAPDSEYDSPSRDASPATPEPSDISNSDYASDSDLDGAGDSYGDPEEYDHLDTSPAERRVRIIIKDSEDTEGRGMRFEVHYFGTLQNSFDHFKAACCKNCKPVNQLRFMTRRHKEEILPTDRPKDLELWHNSTTVIRVFSQVPGLNCEMCQAKGYPSCDGIIRPNTALPASTPETPHIAPPANVLPAVQVQYQHPPPVMSRLPPAPRPMPRLPASYAPPVLPMPMPMPGPVLPAGSGLLPGINVRVQDPTGFSVGVRIPNGAPLSIVMHTYAARAMRDTRTLRFFFKNVMVTPQTTPAQLGLVDNGIIQAFIGPAGV
ncbi:protein tag [Elasticomyces elasticus]|nr:protein tag [Elasticomyces elasticus]